VTSVVFFLQKVFSVIVANFRAEAR